VDVLVNCAGFAFYDDFVRIDWLKHQRMLQVNVVALTHLSHLFAKAMIPRKRGRIMNIASTGAFAPCPNFASYAASKAYVRNLTEALDYELRNTGVRAISVSPGGTRTEFLERGGQVLKKSGEFAMMTRRGLRRHRGAQDAERPPQRGHRPDERVQRVDAALHPARLAAPRHRAEHEQRGGEGTARQRRLNSGP
jgi:short-subunit dehydrogenase